MSTTKAPTTVSESGTKGKIVTVSGNIGVGKSSACRAVVSELVDAGREVELYKEPALDTELFAEYCADPPGKAYEFQVHNLAQRSRIYQEALAARRRGVIAVLDTCVFDDVAFARANWDYFTEGQRRSYTMRNAVATALPEGDLPDVMIYLDASPVVCHGRMLRRGRAGETGTPLSYLEDLGAQYDTVRAEMSELLPAGRVHSEDWSGFPDKPYIKSLCNEYIL